MRSLIGSFIRKITLRYFAGQALSGMLANPDWMTVVKAEVIQGGRGDVPENFAIIAARYARDLMTEIEAQERH